MPKARRIAPNRKIPLLKRAHNGRFKAWSLNTTTNGMVSELLAAADLTKRGYEVYRALSPAAPFDLIAYRSGECFRVEVTTGHIGRLGVRYNMAKNIRITDGLFDLLVVVCDGKAHYFVP